MIRLELERLAASDGCSLDSERLEAGLPERAVRLGHASTPARFR